MLTRKPPETSCLIYLASPYASGLDTSLMDRFDIAQTKRNRFEAAIKATRELTHLGYNVYSPIVHNHPLVKDEPTMQNWPFWEWRDLSMLKRCDELYVLTLEGWQDSVGVTAEITFATSKHLPVWFIGPNIPQQLGEIK